jgi:hypothetical protein
MAVPTSTFQRHQAIGTREDLADVIYDVSPEDTPFISNVGKARASNVLHEWQTDVLASPATNQQVEGDDASNNAVTPTVRIGNYCQILSKTVQVSGTLESVDAAGRRGEMAYQMARRATELKKDLEFALVRNQASAAGSASTARVMGGLESGISTNKSLGTSGAQTAISGATWTAPTDGTQRTFAESLVKSVIKDMYTNGGDPKVAMVGPVSKQNFSGFAGIAANRYMVGDGPGKIIGAADVYLSDFGETAIIPSRIQRDRTAFILDPEYAAVAYLRDFQTSDLAKTGDSERKQIVVEATLELRNEKAHGKVADLTV